MSAPSIPNRDQLFEEHMPLVGYLARRFAKVYRLGGMDTDDLMQEGYLGLLKAMEKYDPSRGYKFSTYAVWWVRQHMSRAIEAQGRMIRIPSYMLERIHNVNKCHGLLFEELGREPSITEMAQRCGLSEEMVEAALVYSMDALSLEEVTGGKDDDEELALCDVLEDPEFADEEGREQLEAVSRVFQALSQQEREVLNLSLGLTRKKQKSIRRIAVELNIPREQVEATWMKVVSQVHALVAVE